MTEQPQYCESCSSWSTGTPRMCILRKMKRSKDDSCTLHSSIRSRPTPAADTPDIFVQHLLKIKLERDSVKRKLAEYEKKSTADEMTSEDWEDVDQLKGWDEALDWALIPTDEMLKQHDANIRKEAYESGYVKALVGNAFRAGELKGAKDERERAKPIIRDMVWISSKLKTDLDEQSLAEVLNICISSLRSEGEHP